MRFLPLKKTNDLPPATAERPHPFEAVPLRREGVEERMSDRGDLHLQVTLPIKGILSKTLAKIAGATHQHQVVLDEKGAFFWNRIDGQTNLFDIRQALQSHYRLSEKESRDSTLLFVKMLMQRHFIQLKMEPKRNSTP